MNPILVKILLILAATACAAVGALVPGVKGTPLGAALLSAAGLSLGLAFPELGKLTGSSKGGQAGFVRLGVVLILSFLAVAAFIACTAAQKSKAQTAVDAIDVAYEACVALDEAGGATDQDAQRKCLALELAYRAAEITIDVIPTAGGSGAQ